MLVHADDSLLVLEKPAGLLCVPGRGADKADCLSARAQADFSDALVVHRLDMATSGLVLMARGTTAQSALAKAFSGREVAKRYVAVVAGRLESGSEWSSIDLAIAADWPNRPRRIVDALHGKASLTRWRALSFNAASGTTRVELEPVTGRTHQLRVHLAAIGHPILGDALYASAEVQAQSPRLLLHASRLAFQHPATGEALAYESAPPF
jgi:tRNA pseudouridine32 synthase/23S rRNA pseudouridine746 synthase